MVLLRVDGGNLDGEPDGGAGSRSAAKRSQPRGPRTTEKWNQPTWHGDAEFNTLLLQYFSLGRVFLIRQEKGNIYARMHGFWRRSRAFGFTKKGIDAILNLRWYKMRLQAV